MSAIGFGPFDCMFKAQARGVPGYLKLLNLMYDARSEFDRIEKAIGAGDPRPWIQELLAEANWRPHLVAAAAYLLAGRGQLDCSLLWHAIDAGSWVTPQLVVTSLFTDPEFTTRASDRIERLCPVAVPVDLDPLERHVACGPCDDSGRRAKMLASLLGVCHLVPSLATREQTWQADEQVRALLNEDCDSAAEIATDWMSAVRDLFQRRGITLSLPS